MNTLNGALCGTGALAHDGAMSSKTDRAIAIGGLLLLLVLHLDFWRPQRALLYFGWVPEELLYRWLWMGLAGIYILFFCARIWRSGEKDG